MPTNQHEYTQEDIDAAVGAEHDAVLASESERYAPLMQAVEQILDAGHMNQECLARLRAAWEAI